MNWLMEDVMVDLETLGKRAGYGILSIGAVFFDRVTGELGPQFYVTVTRRSNKNVKLKEDLETLEWWGKQSKEAQDAVFNNPHALPLPEALAQFTCFLSNQGTPLSKLKVWGNGADFDNAMLQSAYAACNMRQPWEFWNNRCFRTLRDLSPSLVMPRTGTHHNALDDAVTQAQHASNLFTLNSLKSLDVTLIAAKSTNDIIGHNGSMPWPNLPDDLQRFKAITVGHTVIMGRKTWESLPAKPLTGRRNLVISETYCEGAVHKAVYAGAEVFPSLVDALRVCHNSKVFIIGGSRLYQDALAFANQILLTDIKADFEGDTVFPPIDLRQWIEVDRVPGRSLEGFAYDFVTLRRRQHAQTH